MPPDDESGTDTDEDGELIKAKAQVVRQEQEQEPEPEKKPLAKKRPPGESHSKAKASCLQGTSHVVND